MTGRTSDDDCNGSTDDNVLCDFSDRLDSSGNYEKDCQCTPPFLGPVASVELSCSANRSVAALGRPGVTFSGLTGCPTSGIFLGEIDTPDEVQNPFKNCGDGILYREHRYRDSFTQQSNTVTQRITLTAAPPELDESLLDAVTFVPCTDPVDEGALAPTVEIPDDLGQSQCADDLEESYKDISIDYVGCPANPADPDNNKYKGWNVQRRWAVTDQCGQEDFFLQNVVREDEIAPVFDSFPLVRVQSCRASLEPFNTGFPVASDDCDRPNVINPSDWNEPTASGRITYTDTGDLPDTGCPADFEREFVVQDRVCNQVSGKHTIQTCSFDFQPKQSSDNH